MIRLMFSGITFNALNAKFTKWSNTLKQFVDKLPTNSLSAFDYFVDLGLLKGLILEAKFGRGPSMTSNNLNAIGIQPLVLSTKAVAMNPKMQPVQMEFRQTSDGVMFYISFYMIP